MCMLGCSLQHSLSGIPLLSFKANQRTSFLWSNHLCQNSNLASEVGLSSQLAPGALRNPTFQRPYANPAFGAGSRSDDVTGGCAIVMTSARWLNVAPSLINTLTKICSHNPRARNSRNILQGCTKRLFPGA